MYVQNKGARMIDSIVVETNSYIDEMPKNQRKKYGQFFTSKETAMYMASLFSIAEDKDTLTVLDAGAGSGILSCALVERLQRRDYVKKVKLTCYETDSNILRILQNNLEYIKNNAELEVEYEIVTENYITSQYMNFNHLIGEIQNPKKYDIVIGNPPYMKILKDAPEATAMPEVCYGAPNMYFLFASMGVFNLKPNGEMVYIIPRSWTSGAYFKKFREYFLTESKLEHIHLFVSRSKVFDKEKVLQETIIIRVKKTEVHPKEVVITSSQANNDFEKVTELKVPYDIVVSGDDKYVYLVTNKEEIEVLEKLNKLGHTLLDIGLKMKTGLTVDFRNRHILRDKTEEGAIPLFYSQHIQEGVVKFPINKEYEYVVTEQRGLRQQNKINFIDGLGTDLSECVVYGLYVLFNSTLYDSYYRILNGSTQVNSTEVNAMPEKQQTDLCCYTLLAMSNLKENDEWKVATNQWIRIHDIIQFVGVNYGVMYAENSRETFRKQALHHFRTAALIEDNGKATNSPNYRYRLTEETLKMLRSIVSRG